MGLDMYLTGERYLNCERKRGAKKAELIDRGYWRKHPDLHGYIVETFADDDDCRPVYLEANDVRSIIAAIEAEELPKTDGAFFGQSDGSEKAMDLTIFQEALQWLDAEEPGVFKALYYQASW